MKYNNIYKGEFISRPNRFIAHCICDNKEVICHVKNTGRCKELLVKNATVFLTKSDNKNRKTEFDLIAVEKAGKLINIDSQAPNIAVNEYLHSIYPNALIRSEVKFGNSRFDFYIENGEDKIFLEVKGVTLENNGFAKFPDAPTERGIKHINELINAMQNGYKSQIIFVIQFDDVKSFSPNDVTHRAFGDALRNAYNKGVSIQAVNCNVSPDTMTIKKNIPIIL